MIRTPTIMQRRFRVLLAAAGFNVCLDQDENLNPR
jgi:hypothetical protein